MILVSRDTQIRILLFIVSGRHEFERDHWKEFAELRTALYFSVFCCMGQVKLASFGLLKPNNRHSPPQTSTHRLTQEDRQTGRQTRTLAEAALMEQASTSAALFSFFRLVCL